jgi:hypothetical protein
VSVASLGGSLAASLEHAVEAASASPTAMLPGAMIPRPRDLRA